MIVKIKNNDVTTHIWAGQEVEPGEYYSIPDLEQSRWRNDDALLTDIANGIAVVNNGTTDISGVNNQINFLKGNPLLGLSGAPIVESSRLVGQPGSRSLSCVTANLGDRTTWYQKSIQVTNETLTTSDNLTFSSLNPWWININHPTLTYSYHQVFKRDGTFGYHTDWAIVVKVNGTTVTTGFTVDYEAGTVTFNSDQTGNVITATYWTNNGVANCSEWLLTPPAGKRYVIQMVELQYSMNLPAVFDTIRFEIWAGGSLSRYQGSAASTTVIASGAEVGNVALSANSTTTTANYTQPNAGSTVTVSFASTAWMTPGSAIFINGGGIYLVAAVLSGTSALIANDGYGSFSQSIYNLGFGQFRADYRSVWDILNSTNNMSSVVVPKHGGMSQDLFIAPFNYVQATTLDSAVGTLLRLCLPTDTPIPDIELATATFYMQLI